MLNLVIGAAASGKSEYAESMVMALPGERIYVATMEPLGREAEMRIARHRTLRAGKSFRTIEQLRGLAGLTPEPGWNVLLEDLPNLVANEFFSPENSDRVAVSAANTAAETARGAAYVHTDCTSAVLAGLTRLHKTASCVTIVTGDIFSDGISYDEETASYMHMLAALNTELASMADNVIEVVCGIPRVVKGEKPSAGRVRDKTDPQALMRQPLPVTECGKEQTEPGGGRLLLTRDVMQDSAEAASGFIFVTGGLASGKRAYVTGTLGIPETEAAFEVQEVLRENPTLSEEELAENLSAAYRVVTQSEVGAGVIPIAASDRAFRERAGRLACLLASRADMVVRMVCGVPVIMR